MKPNLANIASTFMIASSMYLNSPVYAQNDNKMPSTQQIDQAVEPSPVVVDRIATSGLESIIKQNPLIYGALRDGLKGESAADKEAFAAYWADLRDLIYMGDPTPFTNPGKAKKYYDDRKLRQKQREYMQKHPEEIQNVLSQALMRLKDPESFPEFNQLVDELRNMEGGEKIPYAFDSKGLKQAFPEITAKFTDPRLSPEQQERLAKREMSEEEYLKAIGQTKEEYHITIVNYLFQEKQETAAEKSRRLKKERIKAHEELVKKRESYVYAATSVLALFDENAAYEAEQAFTGGLNVWNGVTYMSEFGFDPTAIGNAATGVKMLLSLMGGKSKSSPMMSMLQEVLKNQQRMMQDLQDLKIEVAHLKEDINYLVRLSKAQQIELINEFNRIRIKLDDIEALTFSTQSLTEELFKEDEIAKRRLESQYVISEFTQRNSKLRIEYKNALAMDDPNDYKPSDAMVLLQKDLRKELSATHTLATQRLEDNRTNSAFTNKDDIRTLEISQMEYLLKEDRETLKSVGMLQGMSEWLHSLTSNDFKSRIEYGGQIVSDNFYAGSDSVNAINAQRLDGYNIDLYRNERANQESKSLPNPVVFSYLAKEFVKLARFDQPVRDKGELQRETRIDDFCEDLNDIEYTVDQARMHIPLAMGAFELHLRQLQAQHKNFIEKQAKKLRIMYDTSMVELRDPYIFSFFESAHVKSDYNLKEKNKGKKFVCYQLAHSDPNYLYYVTASGYTPNERAKPRNYPKPDWFETMNSFFKGSQDILFENTRPEEALKRFRKKSPNLDSLVTIGEYCGVFNKAQQSYARFPGVTVYYIELNNDVRNRQNRIKGPNVLPYFILSNRPMRNPNTGTESHAVLPYHPDAPYYKGLSPEGHYKAKQAYAQIFVKEIFGRHKEIQKAWAKELTDNKEEYLGNLYRSYFVLQTLLDIGYGKDYENRIPELHGVYGVVKDMENIFDFIKNNWEKGINSLERNPSILADFALGDKTLSMEEWMDKNYPAGLPIDSTVNKEMYEAMFNNVISEYYDYYTQNTDEYSKIATVNINTAVFKNYRGERSVKITNLESTLDFPDQTQHIAPYLQDAYDAFNAAYIREELRPPEDCYHPAYNQE